MSDHPTVAFRIEKVREGFFVPVLVDDTGYEHFRMNTAACADQAAYIATHLGSRPLPYLGMFQLRAGVRVDVDDRSCYVHPNHWTWSHHGHTHGALERMERIHA